MYYVLIIILFYLLNYYLCYTYLSDKNMKRKKLTIIIILFIIAVSWIILIYKLSGMNASSSNSTSKNIITVFIEDTIYNTNKYGITNIDPNSPNIDKLSNIINWPLRKVMHGFVYFVLALVILFGINYYQNNKRYLLSVIITIVVIIIAASFDEFHQTFVSGRDGNIKDVIIDTTGALIGIFIFSTYYLTYIRGYLSGYKSNKVL